MRILLLRFSSLGDVILTMPIAQALMKALPGATVDLGTKLEYKGLFIPPDPFGSVLYLDDAGLAPFIRSVNRQRYDIIADLHASLRTMTMMPLLRARTKKRYRKGSFSRRLLVSTDLRLSPFPSVLQRYLGTFDLSEVPDTPWFSIGSEEKQRGVSILHAAGAHRGRTIGIAPGAKWATKKWNMERYVELAHRLEAGSSDVVFVFGKGDEGDRDTLVRSTGDFKILDTAASTLRETAYALASMDVFVSSDTGLMHLAEAAGTPLVVLFGPTTREFGFFPAGSRSIVIEKKLVCRPCSLHGSETCKEGHFRCMEDITVDEIESAVRKLLGDARTTGTGVA